MKRTVSRLFDSHDEAAAAVHDLETAGFDPREVSLVSADARHTSEARSFAPAEPAADRPVDGDHHSDSVHATHGVTKGAAIGAGIGGGATLLAGAGLLAVPGMGPVLAAGFFTTALAGAATGAMTGGMLGALRDSGHSEADAHALAEGLKRGGSIVTVRTPDDRASMAEEILVRHGGVEAAARRRELEAEGWKEFDEQPPIKPNYGV